LIGGDDPQSDQKIAKTFFLLNHMTSKHQLPIDMVAAAFIADVILFAPSQ
jgi:hypothetical protein